MSAVPVHDRDLFTDEILRDPYGLYRDLREMGPVVWLDAHQMYVLPRYAEVRAALADAQTFCSGRGVGLNDFINSTAAGTTLMSDGEQHARNRTLLFGPLTPKALVPLRAAIQRAADELVDELVAKKRFDAVADLARALPLSVVPDLIGWPEDGREHLLTWASATFEALGPPNERAQRAVPRVGELMEFATRTAARGEFVPGGVGSRLLEAVERGEIRPEEAPALVLDYLAPSMDTTISAIGSAVWLLARHPDQWRALRADPGLIPRAVNEVVRLESPIRCFTRVTTDDTTIADHPIPSGSRVMLLYASANRDERFWDRPDEFDIRRVDVGAQLGFGFGTHNCAGQGLARLESQAILTALVARVDTLTLGESVRGLNNLINAFTSVPVEVTPHPDLSRPGPPPTIDVDPQAGTAGELRERYEQLRAGCPVAHIDSHGGYVLVSGYPEIKQVTMARSDFSSADGVFIPPTGVPPVPALEFEGPEHRAWRKVFDELVSPRAVRRLEPVITEVVDAHIDAFIAQGSVDLVPAYTHPVPGVVIGRLLGLDDQESLHSQQLADAFLAAIGTPEFEETFNSFAGYVLGHLNDRRATPRDDVLSQLATGSYQGMDIDDQVAIQIFVSLLLGGHHSTASGLAGLLHHVLTDDGVRAQLLADPAAATRAVEEGLRLTTPLQQFARTSLTDTTIGGYALDSGSRLLLNYAAANRDPGEFSDPHRFRLDRTRNRHLAFGGGAHICSGQHLARAELRIGLERLLDRIPDVALAGEVQHSGLLAAHMMTIYSLPVTFTPR